MAEKKEIRKRSNAVTRYFKETTGEMRKVSWPTREETIHLTWIVLIVMTFMALFLWLVDTASGNLFRTYILGL